MLIAEASEPGAVDGFAQLAGKPVVRWSKITHWN